MRPAQQFWSDRSLGDPLYARGFFRKGLFVFISGVRANTLHIIRGLRKHEAPFEQKCAKR
jgi:hypothetical protein